MKKESTDSSNFPMIGLAWMIGFHSATFFLELLTYAFMVPSLQKMYREFGIPLPSATKFVLSNTSFRLFALLAMLGTLHFIVVGLYAWLAGSNQLKWARKLAFGTSVIWLIWLIFHAVALGLPCLAIIEGLSSK